MFFYYKFFPISVRIELIMKFYIILLSVKIWLKLSSLNFNRK